MKLCSADNYLHCQSGKGPLYQWGHLFASLMGAYCIHSMRLRTWLARMRWFRGRSSNGRFWWPVAPWRPRIVSYLICKRWLAEVQKEVWMMRSKSSGVEPGVHGGVTMMCPFRYDSNRFLFTQNLAVCVVSPAGSGMLTYLRLSQACVGMTLLLASMWKRRLGTVISCLQEWSWRWKHMERTWFVMCKRIRRMSGECDGLSELSMSTVSCAEISEPKPGGFSLQT